VKTAPFWITVTVDKGLEAAVRRYIEERQQAGKEPLEADVMHIIEQHTSFVNLRPRKEDK
jgi:hypothetical protein